MTTGEGIILLSLILITAGRLIAHLPHDPFSTLFVAGTGALLTLIAVRQLTPHRLVSSWIHNQSLILRGDYALFLQHIHDIAGRNHAVVLTLPESERDSPLQMALQLCCDDEPVWCQFQYHHEPTILLTEGLSPRTFLIYIDRRTTHDTHLTRLLTRGWIRDGTHITSDPRVPTQLTPLTREGPSPQRPPQHPGDHPR